MVRSIKIEYDDFYTKLFYITINLTECLDSEIAKFLKLSYEDYRQHIINNFKVCFFENYNQIYYKTYEDAEEACEWITSIITMNYLNSSEE